MVERLKDFCEQEDCINLHGTDISGHPRRGCPGANYKQLNDDSYKKGKKQWLPMISIISKGSNRTWNGQKRHRNNDSISGVPSVVTIGWSIPAKKILRSRDW